MAREGIKHHFEHLNILSKEQEDRLHDATLRVLGEKGTRFYDKRALTLLADLTVGQNDQIEYILNDARNYYRKQWFITEEEWGAYEKEYKECSAYY